MIKQCLMHFDISLLYEEEASDVESMSSFGLSHHDFAMLTRKRLGNVRIITEAIRRNKIRLWSCDAGETSGEEGNAGSATASGFGV